MDKEDDQNLDKDNIEITYENDNKIRSLIIGESKDTKDVI